MAGIGILSPAEYLRRERAAETRSEYWPGGEIVAMAGGSPAHSYLSLALGAALMPAARERGCYVFNSDLKVKTPASAYLYPDLSVACDPKFEGDALLNPSMIVEVLAPTTEARDRTEKFDLYATIASLREYVLVATHPPRIEVFLRQDQGWLYRTFHAGRTATFESLGFALDLNPLYVGLPPPDSAGT